MSARHPTPWTIQLVDNGKRGKAKFEWANIIDDNGIYVAEALDDVTANEIINAVNGFADALTHANECARAAAAEHSARAREVEDAQREANLQADKLRDLVRRFAQNLHRYHLTGERDAALIKEAREMLEGVP